MFGSVERGLRELLGDPGHDDGVYLFGELVVCDQLVH